MTMTTKNIDRIRQSTRKVASKEFRGNRWGLRHAEAMTSPARGFEASLVTMLRAWAEYADAHVARYESPIDAVLGQSWQEIGEALIGLLNGETGRLDCGTLDGLIRDIAAAEGRPLR
jgi:hypothetical protein